MNKIPFEQVDPYSFSRLYGPEKYNLQNMLLKTVKFPTFFVQGVDELHDVWSDRVYWEWREAAKLLKTEQSGDAAFAGATDVSFLAFASKLFALTNSPTFRQRAEELKKQYDAEFPPAEERDYGRAVRIEEAAWSKAAEEVPPLELSGACIVRHTNVSSGYPCLYIMGIKVVHEAEKRTLNGPPIRRPKNTFMDIYERDAYGRHGERW